MKDNQILPTCSPREIRCGESPAAAASNIARGASATAFLQFQTNPPHRILVVEDDIAIRELNTEGLRCSGYEVDAAEDGAAAWQALNTHSYDLLITDNVMPRVTGVELLKKLRAARLTLPVIMATGVLPAAEFSRHPWLQPAATLLKPYTAAEILRTVKKVLREADSMSDVPQQYAADSPAPPPRG